MRTLAILIGAVVGCLHCKEQWIETSPQQRWQWDERRFANPQTGIIPPDAAERDHRFAEQVFRSATTKLPRIASPLVEPIGPTNVAGRIRAFALDRRAPSVLMCGGVTGGIWRSIDRGSSWVRMTPPTLVPHVSCILQSSSDPDTWYVGTGEGLSTTERRTSTQLRTIGTGSGIYRSTDNGTSWHSITPPVTAQPNTIPAQAWQIVWKLASRSDAGNETLYAACYGGIYAWDGTRWRLELGDTTAPAFCTEIVGAGDRLYAAIGATDDGTPPQQYGIFVWTAQAGWQNITPPDFPTVRRIVLAVAPDGQTLYAFTQHPQVWSQRYQSFASQHTLWRYSASANTWENCSLWLSSLINPSNSPLNTLAGYAMALTIHPRNPNVVFLGSTDLFASHDGCRSMKVHLGGYPYTIGTLHPDIHAVVVDPSNPNRLYVATDGGIYSTTDALTTSAPTWTPLNNGLTTTQAYHVALDHAMTDDRLVIAGFQDNSCWYTRSAIYGDAWSFAFGGDGCRVVVGDGASLVFASSQFGEIYALSAITGQLLPLPRPPQSGTAFVTEFAYDPNSGQLVLALNDKLYRLGADRSGFDAAWRLACTLPVPELITAVALTDKWAIVGTAGGTLYRCSITDGTVTRFPVNFPPGSFVAAIDIDRANAQRMIVTISNYTVPSIFATWNGGNTWQSVGGSLDQESTTGWGPSVRVVRALYRNGKRLYIAGTSIGAFITDSLHTETQWQPLGLPTLGTLPVEAIDTRAADGWTVIGTHGGGIFACTLDPTSADTDPTQLPRSFFVEQCNPQPVNEVAIIRVHIPRAEGTVTCELFDMLGRSLLVRTLPVVSAGVLSIILPPTEIARLPAGTYFYRVQWKEHQASGAFLRSAP
ncbi:MAG: hypothetical protein KatS3mg039_1241 [Candidatus Kapaibacterium sp.]|nr:MAG: hypothetical protein KatS3mg039_1241 [Candidatus Kapabacteria bacterium]